MVPTILTAPLSPLRELTPLLPPLDPLKQVLKLSTPLPLVVKQLPFEPSAVGKVKVKLLAVTPDCRVIVLALVLLLNATLPVLPVGPAVPRLRSPLLRVKLPEVSKRLPLDCWRTESASEVLGPLPL